MKDRQEFLKTFYFQNFKSRFFDFLDMTFKETEKEMKKFCRNFWEFKIVNVVVLLERKCFDILDVGAAPKGLEKSLDVGQFDNVIGVYTWFPYRDRENVTI